MNSDIRQLLNNAEREYKRAVAHQRRGFEFEERALALLRDEFAPAESVSKPDIAPMDRTIWDPASKGR